MMAHFEFGAGLIQYLHDLQCEKSSKIKSLLLIFKQFESFGRKNHALLSEEGNLISYRLVEQSICYYYLGIAMRLLLYFV
ncbi:hypothetical protein P3L10_003814 [Capsicum annuum]